MKDKMRHVRVLKMAEKLAPIIKRRRAKQIIQGDWVGRQNGVLIMVVFSLINEDEATFKPDEKETLKEEELNEFKSVFFEARKLAEKF